MRRCADLAQARSGVMLLVSRAVCSKIDASWIPSSTASGLVVVVDCKTCFVVTNSAVGSCRKTPDTPRTIACDRHSAPMGSRPATPLAMKRTRVRWNPSIVSPSTLHAAWEAGPAAARRCRPLRRTVSSSVWHRWEGLRPRWRRSCSECYTDMEWWLSRGLDAGFLTMCCSVRFG
jgi:hypothetical protein